MKKDKKDISQKVRISKSNLDHALKESRMDRGFVQNVILKEGFSPIDKPVAIGPISDFNILKSRFSCHYNLCKFNDVPKQKQQFVTGFGPTNAPIGGTLSIILRAIFFERETGIDSTIIISNLGAFNSRNIELKKLDYLTDRFIGFIRLLGFKGCLRAHNDFNLLVASSLTSKVLTIKDFMENEEVTVNLYKKMGIQGKDFPTFIDANFTVADILLPCILEKKERILVFVGIEEYYFPKLANIVIQRFNKYYPQEFIPKNALVSAAFSHLINGLNGFPKMSKSIPESSINLDDSSKELEGKILRCKPADEQIIFEMINLVSDWDIEVVNRAKVAFEEMSSDWFRFKKEYLQYFLVLKEIWESTEKKRYQFKLESLFK